MQVAFPTRSSVLMSPDHVVAEKGHANKYSDQTKQDGIFEDESQSDRGQQARKKKRREAAQSRESRAADTDCDENSAEP
jgi:hypothetical protein